MGRTRVRRRRLGATLVLVGLGTVVAGPALHVPGGAQAQAVARHAYVVRPGDTLWSIALRVAGKGADPRPVVDQIASANGVSSGLLVPGQTLVLPAGA